MNLHSLQHLQTSLARIDDLIRQAVLRAQAAGQDPTDALRGLVISDDDVAQQVERTPLAGLWDDDNTLEVLLEPPHTGDDLPFQHLLTMFKLTALDAYILLLCLAPEFDRRYERLYAYLQDDVSQRRPTLNLLMNILGGNLEERYAVHERLLPHAPLRRFHLLEAQPPAGQSDVTFLGYTLRVDARLVMYLTGDSQPDARLKAMVRLEGLTQLAADEVPLHLPAADTMVYMKGSSDHTGQHEAAAAVCRHHALPLVTINLAALYETDGDKELLWRLALREGYLNGAGLLLEKWELCLNEHDGQPPAYLWQALLAYPLPLFISARTDWEPLDIDRPRRLLRLEFGLPAVPERRATWQQLIDRHEMAVEPRVLEELANKFRFTRRQIARAVHAAADFAATRGEAVTPGDLYAGAQAHASLRLGKLASRIVPRYDWEDLVLPPDPLAQLRELTDRAMHTHRVHQEWGYGRKIAPAARISALFAGDSGTGKTMSAEVIARTLGLILYKIDLSSVVSKYIGETEKNLGAIFEEARSSNAILFFDEADALFGKRSEVKDARDRYANIEVAYLLQQIENYDGVAIMATNLRQNLDEAFTRRLDFVIDFPFPEAEYRQRIWRAHFPAAAPLAPDLDLSEIAENYRLAGGNIRNAALAAAYLAAAAGSAISMAHLRNAIRREHQKMGRLLDDFEYVPARPAGSRR
ncbi:MAG: ATP-binding protein [Anaerolineae bacterium]|nr:ATP-binding protein [Anaerolineae bacterium]